MPRRSSPRSLREEAEAEVVVDVAEEAKAEAAAVKKAKK